MVARNVHSLLIDNPNDVLLSVDMTRLAKSDSENHLILKILAERLQHADQFNLTLATYDTRLNENHLIKVNLIPCLVFYKAGMKDKPFIYEGIFDDKRILRWLETVAGKKLRYPGDERQIETDSSL